MGWLLCWSFAIDHLLFKPVCHKGLQCIVDVCSHVGGLGLTQILHDLIFFSPTSMWMMCAYIKSGIGVT